MMKSSVTSSGDAPNAPRGRNIVVCCDGTGIGEDHSAGEIVTPSNIVKIFNAVDTTSDSLEREQLAYYERGVGSVGNILTKAGQGLTGFGIGTKITIMYHWLGLHWRDYKDSEEEDRLFLFGFSRGAFAVRSLMGMIYRVGLLDLTGLSGEESSRRATIAFEKGYKLQKDKSTWARGWKFHGDENGRIPTHFLGAFDTVGQLGLPRETWCLWTCGVLCYFKPGKIAFHSVIVNDMVRTARHAVAMDEMRSTFQPVFSRDLATTERAKGRDLKQVWFPGGHANVGGGVLDSGLSDGALKWMIDEASKKGLRFLPNMLAQIKPNFQGNIFLKHGTNLYKNLTFYPRSVPAVIQANCEESIPDAVESIHVSAIQRSENPRIEQAPFWNTHYLQVGEKIETLLLANQVYNNTCVYMEQGATYDISAEGMWVGLGNRPCGPNGYGKLTLLKRPGAALAVGVGKLERGWRKMTCNAEARLPFTRRHFDYPWFSVMGMISTGGTRNVKSEADFHTVFGIGEHVEYQVDKRGGYLYCYANDTWGHYVKNKGTMALVIERIK